MFVLAAVFFFALIFTVTCWLSCCRQSPVDVAPENFDLKEVVARPDLPSAPASSVTSSASSHSADYSSSSPSSSGSEPLYPCHEAGSGIRVLYGTCLICGQDSTTPSYIDVYESQSVRSVFFIPLIFVCFLIVILYEPFLCVVWILRCRDTS